MLGKAKCKNKRKGGFIMKKKLNFKLMVSVVLMVLVLALAASWSYTKAPAKVAKKVVVEHPKVEILMKDGKMMVFELYPEYAPATVANFVKLSKAGFYNGLKFHRIVKDFMIQGGDPKGDGTGGSDKTIKGEFSDNGFKQNTLKHTKGVISMARTPENDSASSQFFIVDSNNVAFLDGKYAAFGKLISGEKTLDAIAATPVKRADPTAQEISLPIKDVIISKVIVLNSAKSK